MSHVNHRSLRDYPCAPSPGVRWEFVDRITGKRIHREWFNNDRHNTPAWETEDQFCFSYQDDVLKAWSLAISADPHYEVMTRHCRLAEIVQHPQGLYHDYDWCKCESYLQHVYYIDPGHWVLFHMCDRGHWNLRALAYNGDDTHEPPKAAKLVNEHLACACNKRVLTHLVWSVRHNTGVLSGFCADCEAFAFLGVRTEPTYDERMQALWIEAMK